MASAAPTVGDGVIVDSYPLVSLQGAMLANHLRAPRPGVDLVQFVGVLRERIDVARLRDAWERVTARHDILRTAFRWEDVAEPRQEVYASAPLQFVALDFSGAGLESAESALRQYQADDRERGFDLRTPQLHRIALARMTDDEWRLVWTFHHILMDGSGLSTVLGEVFALYDTPERGASTLGEPRPFRDFVTWFSAQDFSASEDFWREYLRGVAGPTALPAAAVEERARGRGLHHRWLGKEPSAALTAFASANGLTVNNIVQGGWALLLAHHSGEDEVVFGATRTCRKGTVHGADGMVGLFINTLPVRVRMKPDMPLVEWLHELRATWRSLFAVEHTPLRLVQRWSGAGASTPLFNSLVVFDTQPLGKTMQELHPSLVNRPFWWYGDTNFPIAGLLHGGERFSLEIENDRAVVDDATALRLLAQLATILEDMAAHPNATVGELSPVPVSERTLVVDEWNDTAREYPVGATLVSLLSEQAKRTPDAVAVKGDDAVLTYAELHARASALARRLRDAGVTRDSLVAVCAERSAAMVVALLAVQKAGGAYVPVDPEYPAERIAFMLEDAAAPVLIAHRSVAGMLPPHTAQTIWLDDALVATDGAEHQREVRPDDLAYMIYTSGSTGRPKGALNAHSGIVNRLRWMQDEYTLGASDVVLQKTPFSFDVSVWEFFWPLMTGATLVLARPGGHRDAKYLAETLRAEQVTVCHFVPSMLRAFLAEPSARDCTTLRDVMASGEALPADLVETFYAMLPGARLHNLYGPTECAVDVSYWPCPSTLRAGSVVPIGRPVANTQLYVLDEHQRPVAVGAPGELYLGGAQVGRGYHNRPELTAEKFIADPFATEPALLYRTGDRARWRADGTVEYLGRLDFQVKIRGFRIELGEIESALLAHPLIHDAVVVAHGDGDVRRLVAYVVAEGEAVSIGALREHLGHALPDYMVPAIFVWLTALPLSSNGKVDRRALPAPEVEREGLSRAFVAPRTDVEQRLAAVWRDVLRVSEVGVDDNFFELGGDSLLGVQILARANMGGLRITLTQLLRHPTIAALARVAVPMHARAVEEEIVGAVPLTPVQHWFHEVQRGAPSHWNQAMLLTVPEDVDVAALEEALAAVVQHHDSLRLHFARASGTLTQRLAAEGHPVHVVRADSLAELRQRVHGSLDLAHGVVLGAGLLGGPQARLLIAVHHLAIDAVSWRILLDDLESAYGQRQRGDAITLPARSTPFSSWATRLAEPSLRAAMRGDLAYWENVGSPASLHLPIASGDDAERVAANADTVVVSLTEDETRALFQRVPSAYTTQVNDVLLAGLSAAFGAWLGDGEVVVNVEGHGREDVVDGADLTRTTGWFTTIFPVRLRLSAAGVGERIKATKEMQRGVPQRGLSYGVLRYLDGAETLRAQRTPDVVFNYLGQFEREGSELLVFGPASETSGAWFGGDTRRPHRLEINAMLRAGRLEVAWSFGTREFERSTIATVGDAYLAALRDIIAHCSTPGAGGYTPSDFPLAALDQASVDRLAEGRRDLEDVYPLTPMQELFIGASDGDSDPGFEQWRFVLDGPLDPVALRRAWELVTERHAILRTAFVSDGLAEPLQVVRRNVALAWEAHDWRGVSLEEQASRFTALLAADRAAGFALERAPLMRITLVRHADERHELVWSNHHLLLDRWSWPLILSEIERAYPALASGTSPALERAASYAEFVTWQREQPRARAQEFWARHFEGFDAPPRLTMRRVDAGADDASEVAVRLTAEETTALHAFARMNHIAVSSVVEAAWALCLARRSGHSDVSFGVTVSGRDAAIAGIERLVGLTMNNLPLRVRVDGDATLVPWLAGIHDAQSEMQQYAYSSLASVQEWAGVPWRTRLFETLLVFQYDDADARTQSWLGPTMTTTPVHVTTRTAYPLSVIIAGQKEVELRVTFDARYFDAPDALALAESLRGALVSIMGGANGRVSQILDALPTLQPVASVSSERARVAPRNAAESVIAGIWRDVLGADQVGVNDNFFELGGYSLVATQIASRLRTTFRQDVPVRLLFQHPTVADLAVALAARAAKPGQLERIAQLVQRVQSMSPDELRRAGASRATTN